MAENDETTRVIKRKVLPPQPVTDDAGATVAPERKPVKQPPPLPAAKSTPPPLPEDDDEKTRVYRRPESESGSAPSETSSPTVGWLLIMAGPGRGTSVALRYGMNHIGRSATNRIVLDFGDEEISRKTHTTLTYDPRGKKFYVQPGPDATNLTYAGAENDLKPVLMPVELFGGEHITIGRTTLKFVAFCGPNFSWD